MVLRSQAEDNDQGVAVTPHGRAFRVLDDPLVLAGMAEFESGAGDGTLSLLDAILPQCDQMVDFGAYLGFTCLYAATYVPEVFAFEASPANAALLARNLALNPPLRSRICVFPYAIGARNARVTLYAPGRAGSATSVFPTIELDTVVNGAPQATVLMRDAGTVLDEIGIGPRTLLKIDIAGGEYEVVPAIAELLARTRPVLQVAFHPANIVVGADEYENTAARLGRALRVAEALACYRFMYCRVDECWIRIGREDRMDFLRQYLLSPKPVTGIASPQYGFIGALAFADRALPGLGDG